jgi:hypothetical protein
MACTKSHCPALPKPLGGIVLFHTKVISDTADEINRARYAATRWQSGTTSNSGTATSRFLCLPVRREPPVCNSRTIGFWNLDTCHRTRAMPCLILRYLTLAGYMARQLICVSHGGQNRWRQMQ